MGRGGDEGAAADDDDADDADDADDKDDDGDDNEDGEEIPSSDGSGDESGPARLKFSSLLSNVRTSSRSKP